MNVLEADELKPVWLLEMQTGSRHHADWMDRMSQVMSRNTGIDCGGVPMVILVP